VNVTVIVTVIMPVNDRFAPDRARNKIWVAELVEQASQARLRGDLAALKARGLIEFVGSCRSGRYRSTR
jgi:hypothetical protein